MTESTPAAPPAPVAPAAAPQAAPPASPPPAAPPAPEALSFPKEGEDPAAWGGWSKLGVPEKPDAYAFSKPEVPADLKDVFAYDDGLAASFRAAAHDAKLAPWQAGKVHDAIVKAQLESAKANAAAWQKDRAETEAWMTQAFGDKKAERLAAIAETAKKFGLSPDSPDLDAFAARIGSPRLMAMLDALAQSQGDAALPGGRGPSGVMPADALKAYEQANAKALFDPHHADHQTVKARWNELVAADAAARKK